MKQLGYLLYLYLGAGVLILASVVVFSAWPFGSRLLLSAGALVLDAAAVLDCIRRVKRDRPIFSWAVCAFGAAAAFTLAAVLDWVE